MGPIEEGDDEKLRTALSSLPADRNGHKLLFLSSPGGSVTAAIKAARIVQEADVMSVVGRGDQCISACASVLFLAANYRLVVGNGVLGFHSCYSEVSAEASEQCNELLAERVVGQGIAYGDLKPWLLDPDVKNLIYMDRTGADCWRLTRWPHEERKGVDMSTCAQASLFGVIQDFDTGRKYPVPSGMSPIEFGRVWQPLGRWVLASELDGLRASYKRIDKRAQLHEFSLSCSEDTPGRLYLAFGYSGSDVPEQSWDVGRIDIGAGGRTFEFVPGGSNSQVSVTPVRVDFITLADATDTKFIINNKAGVSLRVLDRSGRLLFEDEYSTKDARPSFLEAAYNCTVQYTHSGLKKR